MTNSIERVLERLQKKVQFADIKVPKLYEGDSIEVQEVILRFKDLLDPSIAELLARGILAIGEKFEQVSIETRNRCVSKLVYNLRDCSDERVILTKIADFQEEIQKSAYKAKNSVGHEDYEDSFLGDWHPRKTNKLIYLFFAWVVMIVFSGLVVFVNGIFTGDFLPFSDRYQQLESEDIKP